MIFSTSIQSLAGERQEKNKRHLIERGRDVHEIRRNSDTKEARNKQEGGVHFLSPVLSVESSDEADSLASVALQLSSWQQLEGTL